MMSKFEPLTRYLGALSVRRCRMSFHQIERVLGFALPPSARKHRPWWSNNPHNSAMTKAWLAAGFRTEQVDMAAQTLVFSKAAAAPASRKPGARRDGARGSPFGGLRGTVQFAPDFDVIAPTARDGARASGGRE
jgi:hypothetical protein